MTDWLAGWNEKLNEHCPGSVRPIELSALYHSPVFLEHMHMLLEHKQALYLQLSGVDLSSENGRYRAAQLQGQIAALDILPELMQLHCKENTDGDSTRG